MTNIPQSLIVDSLKKMISDCHNIHDLLKSDGDYFIKNDYLSVDESNKRKIELLTVLAEDANKLNTSFPGGLKNYINTHIEKPTVRTELNTLLSQLNNEIISCYNFIELHSQYFASSLQAVKQAVKNVLEAEKNETGVYNQSGVIA